MITDKPWISGPRELLVHGIQHLELNTGFDNRIAMISIDNSVELTIKTYLGLPKRITKIEGLTRKRFEEVISSFPNLLDGLEEFANEKLNGIDLGDIEWFHRLRNQLYHDGNGITVEKEKVETYAEIAKILFENLFGIQIEQSGDEFINHNLTGEFIKIWADLEKLTSFTADDGRRILPLERFRILAEKGELSNSQAQRLDEIRRFRNNLVHGMTLPTKNELKKVVEDLKSIYRSVQNIASA
ncbi:hypothetical protein BXU11_13915 [Flavobacterium sp. LM5]|uniref:hypothetical protein n=1 Tax=Flavobacterium sp. LM5 TaxID=1938610 RepID=UPI0009940A00|nr:hypothetical protein [Flavobacterium sp. LM5]OOV25766.1 hypothetical protein BXU11_13915 [Flavobacterium sp. LM5]